MRASVATQRPRKQDTARRDDIVKHTPHEERIYCERQFIYYDIILLLESEADHSYHVYCF